MTLCPGMLWQGTGPGQGTQLAYHSTAGRTAPLRLEVSTGVRMTGSPTPGGKSDEAATRLFDMEARIDLDLLGKAPTETLAYDLVVHRMTMTTEQEGRRTTVELSAKGVIEDEVHHPPPVQGTGATFGEMFGQPVATISMPADGEAVQVHFLGSGSLEKGLGGFRLADNLMIFHPVLPKEAARIGDRWSGRRAVPLRYRLPEPVVLDLHYELAGLSGGLATIRATGSYEGRDLSGADDRGKRVNLSSLHYRAEGQMVLDVEHGELESVDLTLTIDMELVPEGQSTSVGIHMPARYQLTRRSE